MYACRLVERFVIGESTCEFSGFLNTNTSSSSCSYGNNSTVCSNWGSISLTIKTLSFSCISSDKGSYN